MKDVIIIGAGVVGSLIAREISKYKIDCLVLEQENDVGNEVSNANSAIVHSGYDPEPGTLKAKFNAEGNQMYDELSKDLDVHFERIGSLTLMKNGDDIDILKELKNRGDLNGVPTSILNREEVLKLEPYISDDVCGALWAPTAGIIDPFNFVAHAMENACDNGVELHLNEQVVDIIDKNDHLEVVTNKGKYEAKTVINSAGLFACEIAKMLNKNFPYSVVPHKGEYYVLDNGLNYVNHVCFPLPSKLGKGILVSKTTSNNYIVGPNNVVGESLKDKSTDTASLIDIANKAGKNFSFLPLNKTIRVFSGIRPTIENHPDFYIKFDENTNKMINLCGIDSPGFASAPAIAKYVVEEMVSKNLDLVKNENFNPKVKKYIRMKELSVEEKDEVIKNNPDFGQLICVCEQVSLGEIKDVINRSVPVTSIKGIKKRTRAGFGRCQGGFCQPLVAQIISEKYNISLDKIVYDEDDSFILRGLAK